MPGYTIYQCSGCRVEFTQADAQGGKLFRKVVQFVTLGTPSRIVKSITTKWLCKPCLGEDPDYLLEPFRTPGQISPGRERVRRAKAGEAK